MFRQACEVCAAVILIGPKLARRSWQSGTMRPIQILLGLCLSVSSCEGQSIDTSDSSASGTNGEARNVTGVSVGHNLSCALVDGGVQCWGDNRNGRLGNNSTAPYSLVPVQVDGLTSGVLAIAGRGGHTCALVDGGGQQCWGANSNGELGDNSTVNSPVPVQAQGIPSDVTAIAAGEWHTCAVLNGGAQCWGANYSGDLGSALLGKSLVPIQVENLGSGTGVTAVAAGSSHTCAVVNGGAQCWGSNHTSQLGNDSRADSPVPVQVVGLTAGVSALAVGTGHSCAIVNGGVQCWGANDCGQLGAGPTLALSAVPVPVVGLTSGVTAITAGECTTCAVVDGGAQCWGRNSNGELGNNATTDSPVPVQVLGLTSGVTAIAAGTYHTCAAVNGKVQCWGRNRNGQLGNDSTVDSLVPVEVRLP